MQTKTRDDNSAVNNTPIPDRTDDMIITALRSNHIDPTKEELTTLLAVRDFAADHALSVRDISARMRVSNSTVSLVYSGKYGAGIGQFCDKARKWLDREAKSAAYGGHREFVPTGMATDIMTILEKTRYIRRIQPIQSSEQLGKSTVAREYVRRNPEYAALVTLEPEGMSNGFQTFLRNLSKTLGYDPEHQKACDIRSQIDRHLAGIELLIIDEFHLAASWKQSQLCALLDYIRVNIQADGERGVVLIATTPDNAASDTSVMEILNTVRRKRRYNLGQLYGRMTSSVLEIGPDELSPADVEALVKRYYNPGKTCLNYLYRAAIRDGLGHLGLIDSVILDASAEAAAIGESISDDLVTRVLNGKLADIRARDQKGSR